MIELKQLGNTGVMVSEIGLGTWKYRGGVEPLRRGIELGAYLIDTAEIYRTENVVGQAIQGMRERVFIATKVSGEHLRADAVLRAADASLRLLGTEVIDLYQIHWPNARVPIKETMQAIAYTPLDDGRLATASRFRRGQSTRVLEQVATDVQKTLAQVALNWCTARPNVIAIPKSNSVERTVENCQAAGWRLSPAQVQSLDEAFV